MITTVQIKYLAGIATWERTVPHIDIEASDDARFYTGKAEGVVILAVDFDIENQGFPKGSRGYDGTIVKAGYVQRLTREQAEIAFKAASA